MTGIGQNGNTFRSKKHKNHLNTTQALPSTIICSPQMRSTSRYDVVKARMSQQGACDTLSQSMTSQTVRFACDVIVKDAT